MDTPVEDFGNETSTASTSELTTRRPRPILLLVIWLISFWLCNSALDFAISYYALLTTSNPWWDFIFVLYYPLFVGQKAYFFWFGMHGKPSKWSMAICVVICIVPGLYHFVINMIHWTGYFDWYELWNTLSEPCYAIIMVSTVKLFSLSSGLHLTPANRKQPPSRLSVKSLAIATAVLAASLAVLQFGDELLPIAAGQVNSKLFLIVATAEYFVQGIIWCTIAWCVWRQSWIWWAFSLLGTGMLLAGSTFAYEYLWQQEQAEQTVIKAPQLLTVLGYLISIWIVVIASIYVIRWCGYDLVRWQQAEPVPKELNLELDS